MEELRFSNPVRLIRLEATGDTAGYFDQTRTGQAVQNLVSNALPYSPKNSEVTVSLSGREESISVSVHNLGKSIAQGSRNLGLALFIVKEIGSAHRGTIGVTSCPNK